MSWSAVPAGTYSLLAKVTNLWRNSTQFRIFVKLVVPECCRNSTVLCRE